MPDSACLLDTHCVIWEDVSAFDTGELGRKSSKLSEVLSVVIEARYERTAQNDSRPERIQKAQIREDEIICRACELSVLFRICRLDIIKPEVDEIRRSTDMDLQRDRHRPVSQGDSGSTPYGRLLALDGRP